jgi:hypothetical protein
MQGVWEYKNQGGRTVVKVHMFSSPSVPVWNGIETEAERLCVFLNTHLVLEKADG